MTSCLIPDPQKRSIQWQWLYVTKFRWFALWHWECGDREEVQRREAEATSQRVAVGAGMTLRQRLTKCSINGQTKYFWLFGTLFSTEAAAHQQPDPGKVGVASLAKGPGLRIQGFLVQPSGSWAPGGPSLSLPFWRLPPTCRVHRKQPESSSHCG